MAIETEFCVLTVNPDGDIEDVDGSYTKAEAIARLDKLPALLTGWLYTVEGRRWLTDGRRQYKRTGAVRVSDDETIRCDGYSTWTVNDAKWYESGDEPDFEIRV